MEEKLWTAGCAGTGSGGDGFRLRELESHVGGGTICWCLKGKEHGHGARCGALGGVRVRSAIF